jgi:hypothetical protein
VQYRFPKCSIDAADDDPSMRMDPQIRGVVIGLIIAAIVFAAGLTLHYVQ